MKPYILIAIFSVSTNLLAQSIDKYVVNSSGTVLSNNEISLEYSLGEVAVNYSSGTEIIISEGFLQGETAIVSGLKTNNSFDMNFYPNPTTEILNVFISQNKKSGSVHIYSLKGLKLKTRRIETGDQSVRFDLSDLPSGIYLLRTMSDDELDQSSHTIILTK